MSTPGARRAGRRESTAPARVSRGPIPYAPRRIASTPFAAPPPRPAALKGIRPEVAHRPKPVILRILLPIMALQREISCPPPLATLSRAYRCNDRVPLVLVAPSFGNSELLREGLFVEFQCTEQGFGVRFRNRYARKRLPHRKASIAPPTSAAPRSEFADCTVPGRMPNAKPNLYCPPGSAPTQNRLIVTYSYPRFLRSRLSRRCLDSERDLRIGGDTLITTLRRLPAWLTDFLRTKRAPPGIVALTRAHLMFREGRCECRHASPSSPAWLGASTS